MKIFAIRSTALPRRGLRIGPSAAPVDGLGANFWPAREREPWRYDLFQLLRRIDAQAGGRYALGRAPLPRDEPVRLGQQPSLAFSPANVAAIAPYGVGGLRQVDVMGFGLFGPNGPLPLHITEYAYQRGQQENDHSLTAFADIFHHRLIMLFYRAWADTRHCVSFDRADDRRFDRYAACLVGIGQPAQRADGLGARARYFMAGHLTRRTRNREGLEAMLSHFFSVPARVRENQFQWLPLPSEVQLRLLTYGAGARLGENRCLGGAVPDRQYRFAIDLGPLSRRQYQRFLPAADRRTHKLAQLRVWVSHYVGIEFAWQVNLILDRQDYRGVELGAGQPLGQASWLGNHAERGHCAGWVYTPGDEDGE